MVVLVAFLIKQIKYTIPMPGVAGSILNHLFTLKCMNKRDINLKDRTLNKYRRSYFFFFYNNKFC